MTDTPVNPPSTPGERVKAAIGDLARPFAIYVTSAAAAVATVKIAWTIADKSADFSAAAIFITAVFGGLAGLYGFKAWENKEAAKATAGVKVAQAAAGPEVIAAAKAPPAPAAPEGDDEDLSAFGAKP